MHMDAHVGSLPLSSSYSPIQAMNKLTEREAQYGGVLDAVAKILKDEGLAGFYKGGQGEILFPSSGNPIQKECRGSVFGSVRDAKCEPHSLPSAA